MDTITWVIYHRFSPAYWVQWYITRVNLTRFGAWPQPRPGPRPDVWGITMFSWMSSLSMYNSGNSGHGFGPWPWPRPDPRPGTRCVGYQNAQLVVLSPSIYDSAHFILGFGELVMAWPDPRPEAEVWGIKMLSSASWVQWYITHMCATCGSVCAR